MLEPNKVAQPHVPLFNLYALHDTVKAVGPGYYRA